MPDQDSLCIIIPYYNGDDYIKSCLNSIKENEEFDIKVCIVNNSSKSTQLHIIAEAFENVTVVDTTPEIGFGSAVNTGVEYALTNNSEYYVILNQDTILDKECIKELITPLKVNSDLAITAPISYTYDFKLIEEHFIRWFIVQCPDLLVDALQTNLKDYYLMKEVSGACFAIKSSFIKRFGLFPLFDPLYFMYMEDMDLCRRVKSLGFSIGLVPKAKIAHAHSHTTKEEEGKDKIQTEFRRSRGIYILKETGCTFTFSLRNFIAMGLVDYFHNLTRLRITRMFAFFISDVKTIFRIKSIRKSRNLELTLIRSNGQLNPLRNLHR